MANRTERRDTTPVKGLKSGVKGENSMPLVQQIDFELKIKFTLLTHEVSFYNSVEQRVKFWIYSFFCPKSKIIILLSCIFRSWGICTALLWEIKLVYLSQWKLMIVPDLHLHPWTLILFLKSTFPARRNQISSFQISSNMVLMILTGCIVGFQVPHS